MKLNEMTKQPKWIVYVDTTALGKRGDGKDRQIITDDLDHEKHAGILMQAVFKKELELLNDPDAKTGSFGISSDHIDSPKHNIRKTIGYHRTHVAVQDEDMAAKLSAIMNKHYGDTGYRDED